MLRREDAASSMSCQDRSRGDEADVRVNKKEKTRAENCSRRKPRGGEKGRAKENNILRG